MDDNIFKLPGWSSLNDGIKCDIAPCRQLTLGLGKATTNRQCWGVHHSKNCLSKPEGTWKPWNGGGWKMFCMFKRCYVQGGILIACYCRSQGREHFSNLPGILMIQVFTGIQYECALTIEIGRHTKALKDLSGVGSESLGWWGMDTLPDSENPQVAIGNPHSPIGNTSSKGRCSTSKCGGCYFGFFKKGGTGERIYTPLWTRSHLL